MLLFDSDVHISLQVAIDQREAPYKYKQRTSLHLTPDNSATRFAGAWNINVSEIAFFSSDRETAREYLRGIGRRRSCISVSSSDEESLQVNFERGNERIQKPESFLPTCFTTDLYCFN